MAPSPGLHGGAQTVSFVADLLRVQDLRLEPMLLSLASLMTPRVYCIENEYSNREASLQSSLSGKVN